MKTSYFRMMCNKAIHYGLLATAILVASTLWFNVAQAASPTVPIACPAAAVLLLKQL